MLRIAKLHDDAKLPTRKNSTDAGLDLYAYLELKEGDRGIIIYPLDTVVIDTGIIAEIPSGYFGWITNKSKSNYLVGAGIIDEGYQGELLVKVFNPTEEAIVIENGQAIAQLLIIPCKILDIEEVPLDEIHKYKTARGVTGGIVKMVNVSIDPNEELFVPVRTWDDQTVIGDGTAEWYAKQFSDEDYDYTQDDLNYDAERERRSR